MKPEGRPVQIRSSPRSEYKNDRFFTKSFTFKNNDRECAYFIDFYLNSL